MLRTAIFIVLPISLWAKAAGLDSMAQAHSFYFQGDYRKALEIYRSAVREDPMPAEACLNGSLILQDEGRNKEAVKMLEGCAKAVPKDSRLLSALGWAYYHNDEPGKAKAEFQAAAVNGSNRPLNLLGLAQAALKENDTSRALELLKELSEKRPRLALSYYYQGRAYEAQGKRADAVASYQRVIKEDSHFVEVRPFLAELFQKQEQVDEAWRQYAKIAGVDPKNAKAKAERENLTPHLTKKPEEIIPSKKIVRHAAIEPAPDWQKNPVLKIGIGTSAGGNLSPKKTVSFRTAGPFILVDSQTGKELANGEANETWAVRIEPLNPFAAQVVNPQGKVVASFRGAARIRMENPERRTAIVDGLSYAPGYAWGGMADRELRGEVEIVLRPAEKSLVVINHVNLEEYLYGVLNSEMPTHWPTEALKAQSVLARTQALYRQGILKPHRAYGYDLCDEQHCQVYGGVAAETIKARSAVDATRGQILTYKGKPGHTIFFSNCGGHTQSGKEVGWADVPYWQAVFDGKSPEQAPRSPWELKEWLQTEPASYCNLPKYIWSPEFRWTRVVLADDLQSRIARSRNIGRIIALVPMRRSRSGHLNVLKIRGTSGDLVLDQEHDIRRTLGLGTLRSTLFVIETSYRKGMPYSFTFYGGGWGHGVGMCQAGAGGRAEEGAEYKDILSHYYPGTKLEMAVHE